jgi:FtsP/CotA-like multicopper oxidase with cupredoxin domain
MLTLVLRRLNHPIHLHGHDFWVLDQQANKKWTSNPTIPAANLLNPPRRDVATLMAKGYLAIAFKKDNPGSCKSSILSLSLSQNQEMHLDRAILY